MIPARELVPLLRQDPSAVARRVLFLAGMGLIVGLQATTALELSLEVPGSRWLKCAIVVVVIPALFAFFGLRLAPPKPAVLPTRVWLPNAAIMMGLWAGGYFLTGQLANQGPFETLSTPLDESVPFIPEWVFVYLTVYILFLVPYFFVDDLIRLFTLDLAQLMALAVSYATFIVFPVAIDRPAVDVHDFSTWALSVVYSYDPPWNCFPSTHCTACTVASLALYRENRKLGIWAILSTIAIYISTIATKQHFVLDVATGVMLGAGFYVLAGWAATTLLSPQKLGPVFESLLLRERGK